MHPTSNEIGDQLEKIMTVFNKIDNWQVAFKYQVSLAALAITALLNIAEAIRDLKR
jgi:hypothetical protein